MTLKDEAINQGLTEEEFHRILSLLGREPNSVELGILAVMWSEHCSYKTTKVHLRKLPTKNKYVVQGPGENAGVVDIGQGTCVAFKVESHNHPSFIEPYQGAATGVGGILRDIFTMGARPVAVLDSLHFGDPKEPRTPYLFHGVVGGVGQYGNSVGIPNVGGEVHFHSSYNGNNLVNAMAVGVCEKENLYQAKAEGEGNLVVYLGSKTGKDGIHGATMASEEFDEESEEKRPTVQVGDPFMEKLLMETTLELLEKQLVVGIQDMGAAGIACSTFEMSHKSESGMEINLDQVPLREKDTSAYEIFLSESQERMLLVVEPSKLEAVMEVANKWDVSCNVIGKVIGENRVRAYKNNEKVVDLPVESVCEGFEEYQREWDSPKKYQNVVSADSIELPSIEKAIHTMISGPNLSSRSPVFEQYDSSVGNDTVRGPGGDAAIIRIKDSSQKIAVTLESNSPYCQADSYLGTCHTVAEAVRNLACVGARGIGLTNCLNFGNPQEKEVMGQIVESIKAIGDCAKHFDTPVTGGNVSLYNQTNEQNIYPTPSIGMIGILESEHHPSSCFEESDLLVAVVGKVCEKDIYQSEFARLILQKEDLRVPPISLSQESALQSFLLTSIQNQWVQTSHDCSQGGLIQTLVESSEKGIGGSFSVPEDSHPVSFLFGEYASRCVVAFNKDQLKSLEELSNSLKLPFTVIGKTGGNKIDIKDVVSLDVAELLHLRQSFLRNL